MGRTQSRPAAFVHDLRGRWSRWLATPPVREREFKQFLVLALAYRAGIVLVSLGSLSEVPTVAPPQERLLAGVMILVILINFGLVAMVARRNDVDWFADSLPLRVIDLGAVVALNLWSASLMDEGTIFVPYHDILWPYVYSSVVIWTGVRQVRMGLVLVATSVPLQLLMGVVNDVSFDRIEWGQFWAREGWVVLGFLVAAFFISIARGARDLAAAEGRRAGREAERALALRQLHDTSLQTLDGISLRAEVEGGDPVHTLHEIAAEARRQAAHVRTLLKQGLHPQNSVYSQLEILLAEVEGRGVLVPRWVPVGPEPVLSDDARAALVGAVGEAVRNAERHASAEHVTVFIEADDRSVHATVRDDGQGFDETAIREDAFGVRESIRRRLTEAGGVATLSTAHGRGTTWELRVPVADGRTRGDKNG